jgi:phage terminase small subunit
MNEKQKRFCIEYVKDLNATQAYIRAGYSSSGASQSAERLLRNADISEKVEMLQEEIREKNEITLDKVVDDLIIDRNAAREKGVYTAAIRATIEIAKLHGLYELHNRQQNDSLEHLTREQLVAKINSFIKPNGVEVQECGLQ